MLIPASSTNFGHQRRLGKDKVNSKMKFKWDSDVFIGKHMLYYFANLE